MDIKESLPSSFLLLSKIQGNMHSSRNNCDFYQKQAYFGTSKLKFIFSTASQNGFNNKQTYYFIFLFLKKNISFEIIARERQTWLSDHTVWSCEPQQLT
jgi:hypothetical protein